MCILSVYSLLKVVGYYDLSVLSMSVMSYLQKSLDGGGWGELYPFVWDISFLTLQSPFSKTLVMKCFDFTSTRHTNAHNTQCSRSYILIVFYAMLYYDFFSFSQHICRQPSLR